MPTQFERIQKSTAYQNARKNLLETLRIEQEKSYQLGSEAIRPSSAELSAQYDELCKAVGQRRGRELYYPLVASGGGRGPFVELLDGSVKYDLITGIGVNFFGYGNLELASAQIDVLLGTVMQGNLSPGPEYAVLGEKLLEIVGAKSKLKHVWLSTCGATVNETALKIVRQKAAPASKIFAFRNCFAGRTTALQEITDNPKYREGQPVYGEVFYLSFFDEKATQDAATQGAAVARVLEAEVLANPKKYCVLELELVQGEGGFANAPREFFEPIFRAAKKAGLSIWIDEVQTFGRTGEYFCFQRLNLDEWVDVVTVAKLLQTGAVLYSQELNPKPGLISGTFAGASASLAAAIKVLDLLKPMVGRGGTISRQEKLISENFSKLKNGEFSKEIVDFTVVGGMVACTLFDGTLEVAKKFLLNLWKLGAIAFFCGHGPYRVRMLPPLAVMNDEHINHVFELFAEAIRITSADLKEAKK